MRYSDTLSLVTSLAPHKILHPRVTFGFQKVVYLSVFWEGWVWSEKRGRALFTSQIGTVSCASRVSIVPALNSQSPGAFLQAMGKADEWPWIPHVSWPCISSRGEDVYSLSVYILGFLRRAALKQCL